jgi:hypothetical protein
MPSYLRQIRRRVAGALDDLSVHVVTGASSTTVTATTLSDGTSVSSVNRYDGAWVYSPTPASQQRRVRTGGLNPMTGTLTVDVPWTAPFVGTEIEITRLMPSAGSALEATDYNSCINRAASKLLIYDRVTIPITTADTYPLTSQPWLDRPERLLRVLEPPATGTRPIEASWRSPKLVWSGGYPSLELDAPFDFASGNLTLEVMRPCDSWIGGERAPGTGMTTDPESCLAPLEDIALLALMEVLYVLMQRSPGRPGQWEVRYSEAKERAEALYFFDGAFYRPKATAPQVAVA